MASFDLKSIFCLLVAVFCFINHDVEAREGKLFFSKFTRVDLPNNKEVVLPSAPAPAPGLAQANGRLRDGHFGPGSGMIPQTKESWPSTTTDEDFEKLMATFDEEKGKDLPEEFEEEVESEDSEDLNEQKDIKYNNKNTNGYTYKTSNNYDANRRSYGNEQEERQGMSDTRFMENGKYFYDTRGRNSENTPSRGYENARGNNDHPNEFDTMEEYYKSLEGTQEEFEP